MTRTAGYVAVVLAAGASRRMGEDRNKLLEEIDGRPIVAGVVEAFVEAGFDRVIVIVGHEEARVRDAIEARPGVECVSNPSWADGMGRSLSVAARTLSRGEPSSLAGVLVAVGDLPGLGASEIRRVRSAHADDPDPSAICVPVCGGRSGHPVLFGSAHLQALSTLDRDRGARDIIAAHPDDVRRVEVESEGIFRDVDTPEDLAAARRR